MTYRVVYDPPAANELRRLPPAPRRLVRRYLRALGRDEWSSLDIAELRGYPGVLRLVADGYRVLFRRHGAEAQTLTVIRIRPRATAYEGFELPRD